MAGWYHSHRVPPPTYPSAEAFSGQDLSVSHYDQCSGQPSLDVCCRDLPQIVNHWQKLTMSDQTMQSEYWDPHHNDLCEGGVTIAEFKTEEECNFAVYLLAEGGIRSGVLLPERRLDLRPPQVRVSPDDEAVARNILAQPITAAKRAEYNAEPECELFCTPSCPKCMSCEIVLDSVANGNLWRCDVCGESWTEVPNVTDAF